MVASFVSSGMPRDRAVATITRSAILRATSVAWESHASRGHSRVLPCQEYIGSDNERAFAALDACKKDGDRCTTGIDCCGLTCSIPSGAATSEFGDPVGTCAAQAPNETTAAADYCDRSNYCINRFCTFVDLL